MFHGELIAEKIVHTEKEYRLLLSKLHKDGYEWIDGETLLSDYTPPEGFPSCIKIYTGHVITHYTP